MTSRDSNDDYTLLPSDPVPGSVPPSANGIPAEGCPPLGSPVIFVSRDRSQSDLAGSVSRPRYLGTLSDLLIITIVLYVSVGE